MRISIACDEFLEAAPEVTSLSFVLSAQVTSFSWMVLRHLNLENHRGCCVEVLGHGCESLVVEWLDGPSVMTKIWLCLTIHDK